jgi:hypothetical protein
VPDDTWTSVVAYSDRISAEAALGLLTGEGLPAYLASDEHVPGIGTNFSVRVPTHLRHAAERVLAQTPVSESELIYQATGERSDGSKDP